MRPTLSEYSYGLDFDIQIIPKNTKRLFQTDSTNKLFSVYYLSSTRNEEVKYIGITYQPLKKRLQQHIRTIKRTNHLYKSRWIIKELRQGFSINIHLIYDNLILEEACRKEVEVIKDAKAQGYQLTNLTNGGEGSNGLIVSKETRAKISIASKGNKYSVGRKCSIESIEKRMIKIRGKKMTGKALINIVNAHKQFRKPVLQYSIEGILIQEHESKTKAFQYLGLKTGGGMEKALNDSTILYKGFIWKYKPNIEKTCFHL